MIDGITFQTNLLALNTAGSSGAWGSMAVGLQWWLMKFANWHLAVATPPRISASASVLNGQGGNWHPTGPGAETAMNELADSVTRSAQMLAEISTAASEQSDGISQVSIAVTNLDQMTQQNAALVGSPPRLPEQLKDQRSGSRQRSVAFA